MQLTRRSQGHAHDRLLSASRALGIHVVLTSCLGALAWVVTARLMPTGGLALDPVLLTAMVAVASVAKLGGTVTLPRFRPVSGLGSRRAIRTTSSGTWAVGAVLSWAFVLVARRITESYGVLADDLRGVCGR